jgi:proline iminopeptidase
MLTGSLALACMSKASLAAKQPQRGRLVKVRGTHLYVEDSGPRNAPALVYLHGGPGVGSYEFSHYARASLSKRWRLIVFDQRGVLRSDPIGKDEKYGMDDLVADTDALRKALGIRRWSLLGHSFGGHYALRYALAHSDRTDTMFLENPAYSFPDSTRSSMQATAALYRRLGKPEMAREAEALAASHLPPRQLFDAAVKVMGGLGEDRQQLYLYDQKMRGFFGRLSDASGLPDRQWEQGQVHAMKLIDEGKILQPMLKQMSGWRGLTVLIKGETDHACSAEEEATVAALPKGKVIHVPRAGHFIHVERATALADAIQPRH